MLMNAGYWDLLYMAAISFIAGWVACTMSAKGKAKEAESDMARAEHALNRALAIFALVHGDGWTAEVPTDEVYRLERDRTRINLSIRGKVGEMAKISLSVRKLGDADGID